jgi:hypothetical protein
MASSRGKPTKRRSRIPVTKEEPYLLWILARKAVNIIYCSRMPGTWKSFGLRRNIPSRERWCETKKRASVKPKM